MITKETTLNQAFAYSQITQTVLSRCDYSICDNSTISQVAQQTDLNENFLVDTLNHFIESQYLSIDDFKQYSIDTLTNYLIRSHRYYLDKKLPEMEQTINMLVTKNKDIHPGLQLLNLFFLEYRKELFNHFELEENLLFPYAYFLDQSTKGQHYLPLILENMENFSIKQFTQRHENSHQELSKVRKAILSYKPSSTDASPYRILLEQLKYFEQDLHFHAMIEDDVLIPKLRKIEIQLKSSILN
jgi:regulator of cell morphogenesis and NO signaling